MGFKTSSTRFTQAKSAQSSDTVAYNNATGGTSVAGSGVTATTVINTVVTTPGAPATSTTIASGPTIANIQYLDANNAVISGDIAVSTTGGNILITGSGFVANSSVYLNNYLVSNTFISSTQIIAVCPAASSGNVGLMIFTPTLVGTIRANGVRYSGAPTWTTAAVSFQNNAAGNVALVASSDSTLTYTLQAGSTLPTGISLVSAGYLSGTATGYSTNTSSTAVIIATDLEGQATQQTLNITVTVADPQFPYTTLLLNGETSVTPFIADASTNNLQLTVVGDTKATKFSPYRGDGYYSNYLSTTSTGFTNASATHGLAGNFTIEFWHYPTVTMTSGTYYYMAGASTGPLIAMNGGVVSFAHQGGFSVNGSAGVVQGQWNHIACVRSGTTVTVYLNGVSVGSGTDATNFSTAQTYGYGVANNGTSGTSGYISNFRITDGQALYTGTFTPSTAPLTTTSVGASGANVAASLTGTVTFLGFQSNRFIDKSASAVALTLAGTPQVSPAIPFAANSSYATYGSAYFDGVGDYLTVTEPGSASAGTDVTVECWVYPTNITARNFLVSANTSTGAGVWAIAIETTGAVSIWVDSYSAARITTSTTLALNQWHHLALVKSSGTVYAYVNGVRDASTYVHAAAFGGSSSIAIGAYNVTKGSLTFGYLGDVRYVRGTAIYTGATVAVPTTPLTAVANTQLLTCQYNGGANNYGIIDNGPFNNALTRLGNATQGTFSPYSPTGWSINYPALAYMTYAANPIGTFGVGATFTVEGWVNMTNYAATNYFFSMLASCDQATATYWAIGIGSTGLATVYWYDGATKSCAGSTVLTKGTWYHVAVNVTAGVVKIYINGNLETLTGTTTLTNPTGNSSYTTGCERGSSNGGSSGYISNLRTNTGALYPSAFTPSTSALTNVANTTLLTAQSNRYIDNSSSARAITPFATTPPSIQAFSPFAPGISYTPSLHSGSTYFDGTGDYLTTPANPVLTLGGDFTIECWVYTTIANQTYGSGIVGTYDGGSNGGWSLTINRSSGGTYGIIFVHANALQQTYNTYLPTNTWHHIAIARSGSTLKTFLNGAQVATGTYATADAVSATCYIGSQGVGSYHTGYISDVRVVKGAALYTTTFTPPTNTLTSPTTTPAGLLLNFSNGGVVDQSSKVILDQQTTPPPQLSTNIKKYGTSSIDCTGGKYMYNSLASQNLAIGTGDFTFEAWIYVTNTNVNGGMINLGSAIGNEQLNFHVYLTTLFPYFGGSARNAGTAPSNTWNHYAIVRQNGVSKFYLDGVFNTSIGAIADSTNYTTSVLLLGAYQSTLTASCYIDDLRITKGFARYTANFTPPTSGVLGQ
jgi:Concanavalin A-like lectin/glucanases superfamily